MLTCHRLISLQPNNPRCQISLKNKKIKNEKIPFNSKLEKIKITNSKLHSKFSMENDFVQVLLQSLSSNPPGISKDRAE